MSEHSQFARELERYVARLERYVARRRFWMIVSGIPICGANLALSFATGDFAAVMMAIVGTFMAIRLAELIADHFGNGTSNSPDR